MRFPHYKNNTHANPFEPIMAYCGNCYSNNILQENGYFYIDVQGRCECLDCGFKGTKDECNYMYGYEWEKKHKKNVIRNRKLKRINDLPKL